MTQAIYGAGFQANSRFYESSTEVLGMRPKTFRAGATARRFASRSASAGWVRSSSRRRTRGCARSSWATTWTRLARDLQDRFPAARDSWRRPRLRAMDRQGGRVPQHPCAGPRSSARHPRHGVSTTRLGGLVCDPCGVDGDVHRDCSADRPAEGRACGGIGLARPIPSRLRSLATAWCGPTGRSRVIGGESTGREHCSAAKVKRANPWTGKFAHLKLNIGLPGLGVFPPVPGELVPRSVSRRWRGGTCDGLLWGKSPGRLIVSHHPTKARVLVTIEGEVGTRCHDILKRVR